MTEYMNVREYRYRLWRPINT